MRSFQNLIIWTVPGKDICKTEFPNTLSEKYEKSKILKFFTFIKMNKTFFIDSKRNFFNFDQKFWKFWSHNEKFRRKPKNFDKRSKDFGEKTWKF